MNNPMQLLQALKNPQQFLQNSQMMQNPIMKNAIEMYQRGDKEGIDQLADNLCKERGINRQDFEKQIREKLGM
jgi:hypothetical protein